MRLARRPHARCTKWGRALTTACPPCNCASTLLQASVSFGHCKGLLCWSADRVGWLVHSVPGWPAALGEQQLTTLAGTRSAKKGQSFVWLCMARTPERLRAICGAWGGAATALHCMPPRAASGRLCSCTLPPARSARRWATP